MDDFEELKPGESVIRHLIAGAAAGTVEHCGMFPIDTIKTIMQAKSTSSASIVEITKGVVNRGGIIGLFRGFSAIATGAAPAHALHFATYEFCKESFGGADPEGHHPLSTGAAGICATVISDAVLTPMDAVKQRMQLGERHYKGMLDCIRTILRSEGPGALYASYTTTLLMNVPYHAIYFASYESLRKMLKRGSEQEFDVLAHCLSGGGAGMIAAALTNPMDVAKTRLQTQGDVVETKKYRGMLNTLTLIWKEEGKAGYLRGIKPRIALHSMSASLCWLTYEYSKFLLTKLGVGA